MPSTTPAPLDLDAIERRSDAEQTDWDVFRDHARSDIRALLAEVHRLRDTPSPHPGAEPLLALMSEFHAIIGVLSDATDYREAKRTAYSYAAARLWDALLAAGIPRDQIAQAKLRGETRPGWEPFIAEPQTNEPTVDAIRGR